MNTCGLEAHDVEAALGGLELIGEAGLDLVPDGQHEAAEQVQLPQPVARARLAVALRVRTHPHLPGRGRAHRLVPAHTISGVSMCRARKHPRLVCLVLEEIVPCPLLQLL